MTEREREKSKIFLYLSSTLHSAHENRIYNKYLEEKLIIEVTISERTRDVDRIASVFSCTPDRPTVPLSFKAAEAANLFTLWGINKGRPIRHSWAILRPDVIPIFLEPSSGTSRTLRRTRCTISIKESNSFVPYSLHKRCLFYIYISTSYIARVEEPPSREIWQAENY